MDYKSYDQFLEEYVGEKWDDDDDDDDDDEEEEILKEEEEFNEE